MGIQVRSHRHGSNLILAVTGRIEPDDLVGIARRLARAASKDCTSVVVDLSDVPYIDSRGLGVFVHSWKVLRDNGKKLAFLIPPGFVRNLFTAANLGLAFRIVGSLAELDTDPG